MIKDSKWVSIVSISTGILFLLLLQKKNSIPFMYLLLDQIRIV